MKTDIYKNAEYFFEYGINLDTSTLYLGSTGSDCEYDSENGIDYSSAEQFIKGFNILENESDKDITVILNNPGGDEFQMFAIYDRIRCSARHVTIECYGQVMSAASIILQAADTRLISQNTYMLIHVGTFGFYGHSRDMKAWSKVNDDICNKMYEIYHSKMVKMTPALTVTQVKHLIEFDKVYDGPKVVELGLADDLILPYGENSTDV